METKEQELASECGLTLVTEMDAENFDPDIRREAFALAGIHPEETHDLLTMPSIKVIAAEHARMERLVKNIKLALSVHRPETIALMHRHLGSSCQTCLYSGYLLDRLWRETKSKDFDGVEIKSIFIPEKVRQEQEAARRRQLDDETALRWRRLVITCMDYRLHKSDSLPQFLKIDRDERSRYRGVSWLTYPGAAYLTRSGDGLKQFADDLDYLLRQTPAFDEIYIVSHTDCAKYKTDIRLKVDDPDWSEIESKVLTKDLLFASACLCRFFPAAKIHACIAIVKNGKAIDLVDVK